jgi:hypothetical protein
MSLLRLALFFMAVSASACAGSQPVRLQLPPGARIGIVNALEAQMTHVAVGALRFNSFTNVHTVDWDIPNHIDRTLEKALRERGGHTVVPLTVDAPAGWERSTSNGVLSAVNGWMPRGLRSFLERMAEESRLDAIVTVTSYDSGSWPEAACFRIGKDAISTRGYGLFTRDRALSGLSSLVPVGRDLAVPYANVIVAVFHPRPPALVAYGRAPCSRESLPEVAGSGRPESLTPAVIGQLRPYIEQLVAAAAQSALEASGLLP